MWQRAGGIALGRSLWVTSKHSRELLKQSLSPWWAVLRAWKKMDGTVGYGKRFEHMNGAQA